MGRKFWNEFNHNREIAENMMQPAHAFQTKKAL